MAIREGSVVNVRRAEASGPGSQDSTETNATVIKVSSFGLDYMASGTEFVVPWAWIRYVQIITY